MRILVLSRWLPHPPDNGSRIRIGNLVRTLAAQHRVILLAFTAEDTATQAAAHTAFEAIGVDVRLVPYRRYRPASSAAIAGLFARQPRFLTATHSPQMADAVRTACRTARIDCIVATELDMAPYAVGASIPALLEDLELGVHHDAPGRAASPAGRIRASLTWWKLRAYLQHTLPRFAACTVVSEREQALVRAAVPAYDRVHVVPNGVDLARHDGNFGAPVPDTLVHAGALTYGANLDGVSHFLGDIFPLIRAEWPDARLRVTGAAPPSALAALPPSPDVEFTGHVPDIRPVVAQGWLSVVPLRIGGGTRLKVLESMALGTPVVTTPKGAEGLAVQDGQEVLIGATPAAFAHAVTAVLRSPDLRACLARAGRERVETTYNWTTIGRDLVQLVESLPDQAGATTGRRPAIQRATTPGSEPA